MGLKRDADNTEKLLDIFTKEITMALLKTAKFNLNGIDRELSQRHNYNRTAVEFGARRRNDKKLSPSNMTLIIYLKLCCMDV